MASCNFLVKSGNKNLLFFSQVLFPRSCLGCSYCVTRWGRNSSRDRDSLPGLLASVTILAFFQLPEHLALPGVAASMCFCKFCSLSLSSVHPQRVLCSISQGIYANVTLVVVGSVQKMCYV